MQRRMHTPSGKTMQVSYDDRDTCYDHLLCTSTCLGSRRVKKIGIWGLSAAKKKKVYHNSPPYQDLHQHDPLMHDRTIHTTVW